MAANYGKYRPNRAIELSERHWPNNRITKAPIWCSVDLRDGNQALIEPMSVKEKHEFFKLLVKLGFKQIEVGFPASSQIEYDFVSGLEFESIPEDVYIQVLSQCRENLIKRTWEAVKNLPRVIFHIYNNTSPLQREAVYGLNRQQIKEMAVNAVLQVKEYAKNYKGELILEYSPESFNETEPEFVLEVCDAVINAWDCGKGEKMIIDFPTTVEKNTPNVLADSIEWISQKISSRENIVLSIHPHNDRGTGVAASELALLAGVERIEGTVFGNGERSGNVDIINLAGNMMAEGVNPGLDLSNLVEVREIYERLVKMNVPERLPYAGELVFTAFSGGHQDAINKCLKRMEKKDDGIWEVPYLPIDPADVGRKYEAFVRINSQSGSGGLAYIMENCHGFKLPKEMQIEFSGRIKRLSESEGELNPNRIMEEFKASYIDKKEPYHFRMLKMEDIPSEEEGFHTVVEVTYTNHGIQKTFSAKGNGPIDAVKTGLQQALNRRFRILDYSEHALKEGSNAQAAAYIHLSDEATNRITYGVGVSSSTTRASIRAIFSALNRMEE